MIECPKIITINGQNNKYQIKKATKQQNINKERVSINFFKINDFEEYNQLQLLTNVDFTTIIFQEVNKKIAGYKSQDIKKKIYDETKIINLNEVMYKLSNCQLKCYYCIRQMKILYKMARDSQQWTIDRIDNSQGHNTDNIVLCCLECNLKRRLQPSEKFLFTKQLKIVKA